MCQSYLICESCEVFQLTNEGHLQTKLQPLKRDNDLLITSGNGSFNNKPLTLLKEYTTGDSSAY